jgi:hypothetical protein
VERALGGSGAMAVGLQGGGGLPASCSTSQLCNPRQTAPGGGLLRPGASALPAPAPQAEDWEHADEYQDDDLDVGQADEEEAQDLEEEKDLGIGGWVGRGS